MDEEFNIIFEMAQAQIKFKNSQGVYLRESRMHI